MIRNLLATTAIFFAAPVIAQDMPDQTTPASPATPLDQAMGGQSMDSADQAATPAGPAGAQPENSADQVAQLVNGQFPTYDADSSGTLDKSEFSSWMVALKNEQLKASGETMTDADKTAWAAGAFATADTDKSSTITREELSKFLGGA